MKILKIVLRFWRLHGFKSLIIKILTIEKPREEIIRILSKSKQNTCEIITQNRFPSLKQLNCYYSPHSGRRLNLVTDSINSRSLFGGVATSMILATLIAKKWGCDLRIITRNESSDKHNYLNIIKHNNLHQPKNVDFSFVDYFNENSELPVGDDEYFLTTSWWTTHSTLQSINENRIYYIIQEDERTFYPFGDDHYLCSQILNNNRIKFFVNSQLLFNNFLTEGFVNFKDQGNWFEPSFPKNIYYYEQKNPFDKKNFFFYARPNNIRNLYYLGIRVINQALETGLFDPEKWNIYFVGKEIEKITFAGSIVPNIFQNLSWDEYGKMIRKMDLGLCLMYTPHPSYPPLDLAASGAIAITNKYANKQNLDEYSKNILCCDLNENSLLEGIKSGVVLSSDIDKRIMNYRNNGLLTDWSLSFDKILSTLETN